MTYNEFLEVVATRLEWPVEKVADVVGVITEMMAAELKMNNPVVLEDFGVLKTDIQSEYILVNLPTKERFLMPPVVDVFLEPLSPDDLEIAACTGFTSDEGLFSEINSSFAQFEPTLLNEGVEFPDIPEFVDEGLQEEEPPSEYAPVSVLPEESGGTYPETKIAEILPIIEVMEDKLEDEEIMAIEHIDAMDEITEVDKVEEEIKNEEDVSIKKEEHPLRQYRSGSRKLRRNKRTTSVWIPIAGGLAIVVASLFFFERTIDK